MLGNFLYNSLLQWIGKTQVIKYKTPIKSYLQIFMYCRFFDANLSAYVLKSDSWNILCEYICKVFFSITSFCYIFSRQKRYLIIICFDPIQHVGLLAIGMHQFLSSSFVIKSSVNIFKLIYNDLSHQASLTASYKGMQSTFVEQLATEFCFLYSNSSQQYQTFSIQNQL